jgi:predicted PurR-regulated permease PerM
MMTSPRRTVEERVTFWLKVVVLVVLVWLIVTRLVHYVAALGFVAVVAIGGLFVAYVFYPIVRRLNERLPLWAAIAVVYLGATVAVIVAASYVLPVVVAQLHGFLAALPAYENSSRRVLNDPHLPFWRLPQSARIYIESLPTTAGTYVQQHTTALLGDLLGMLLSAVAIAALFVAIPVVSIYMLAEAESTKRFLLGVLPARGRERAKKVLADLDEVVGGFVRGQIVVALTVGIMTTLLLLVLRVPYALLIGVWAGLVDVVPYLGAFAGAIPAILIALITNGFTDALFVTIGFVVINQIEGHLLAPRIVSRTVRVTPLVVVFAVLIGGELFGLAGMFVAVPVAGVLRVIIENVRPPETLTNAEVEPALTKLPQPDVDPAATTTAASL